MKQRIFTIAMLALLAVSAMAQTLTVTGVVMAQDEPDPVIGANVMVKGTTVGTITDFDGNFSIQAKAGDVLQVSFMGYKPLEVKVSHAGPINVTLIPDNVQLQEVVAIGYGTMKKSDLTGAVTSVSADQLLKAPVAGLDQALQGRAAGVTVTSNSGQPGDSYPWYRFCAWRQRPAVCSRWSDHERHQMALANRHQIHGNLERRLCRCYLW